MGPLKTKMQGLKGPPVDDEETRKGKTERGGGSHILRALTHRLTTHTLACITARQNERLREWLGENGVWMSDRSGWGVPPHPLGVLALSLCVPVGVLYTRGASMERSTTLLTH